MSATASRPALISLLRAFREELSQERAAIALSYVLSIITILGWVATPWPVARLQSTVAASPIARAASIAPRNDPRARTRSALSSSCSPSSSSDVARVAGSSSGNRESTFFKCAAACS